ncbi:MAG: glutamate--cysteine ligase [Kiritimatiellae bacterium]|nr:glutamate--cysteine ligase [Kiritimatiellia bacterium]
MTYALFECVGIELEYMVVDPIHGGVLPMADALLQALALPDGGDTNPSDVTRGQVSWSNELVNHVVELKVTDPVPSLKGCGDLFHQALRECQPQLDGLPVKLMPTAMHPLMNPAVETVLWPHEYREIYQTYHRIYDCYRHGWANVQSVHINLPFRGDREFAVLHAAIRALLPLLPGLAAASPIQEGRLTGIRDNRLIAYAGNSLRIPQATGQVIPEPITSEAEYDAIIMQPLYRAVLPHDPGKVLQHEFLNSRGAIARFDRGAIEIRLLDVQECPSMDIAIAEAVIHALRQLVSLHWANRGAALNAIPTDLLRLHLDRAIIDAEETRIDDADYLRLLGLPGLHCPTLSDVWKCFTEKLSPEDRATSAGLDLLSREGTLATRIARTLPPCPDEDQIRTRYSGLCEHLMRNQPFSGLGTDASEAM